MLYRLDVFQTAGLNVSHANATAIANDRTTQPKRRDKDER